MSAMESRLTDIMGAIGAVGRGWYFGDLNDSDCPYEFSLLHADTLGGVLEQLPGSARPLPVRNADNLPSGVAERQMAKAG
jgi:hypothetical protein